MTDKKSTPAPRAPRKDVTRNREHLLTIAGQLLEHRGMEFSLNELATAAGVGVGTVYRHFSNKHKLIDLLMEEPLNELEEIASRLNNQKPSTEIFRKTLIDICELLTRNKATTQVIFSHREKQAQEAQARILNHFRPTVETIRQLPGIRKDLAVTDLPFIFAYSGFLTTLTHRENPDLWRRYIGALIDGLLASSSEKVPAPLTAQELSDVITREQQRLVTALQE